MPARTQTHLMDFLVSAKNFYLLIKYCRARAGRGPDAGPMRARRARRPARTATVYLAHLLSAHLGRRAVLAPLFAQIVCLLITIGQRLNGPAEMEPADRWRARPAPGPRLLSGRHAPAN